MLVAYLLEVRHAGGGRPRRHASRRRAASTRSDAPSCAVAPQRSTWRHRPAARWPSSARPARSRAARVRPRRRRGARPSTRVLLLEPDRRRLARRRGAARRRRRDAERRVLARTLRDASGPARVPAGRGRAPAPPARRRSSGRDGEPASRAVRARSWAGRTTSAAPVVARRPRHRLLPRAIAPRRGAVDADDARRAVGASRACFALVYERAVLRHRLRVQRQEMRQVASWADARTSELGDRSIGLDRERHARRARRRPVRTSGVGENALRDLLTRRELDVLRAHRARRDERRHRPRRSSSPRAR